MSHGFNNFQFLNRARCDAATHNAHEKVLDFTHPAERRLGYASRACFLVSNNQAGLRVTPSNQPALGLLEVVAELVFRHRR